MYEKLKKMMKSVGVTQLEMCNLLGITPLTFIRKINGRSEFTLKEAIKIKNYMNKILDSNYTLEEIFVIKK